ncbi:hypothetical protein Acsp01_27930 [Actinoplanes sp. NBRC 101535]|nr:hypothetical protein Acsp01_27930 [Actinoplanes sp. NBRC 101535]
MMGMDFLLDVADRMMGELRRRYPWVLFGVAMALWLPVLVFLTLLMHATGWWPLVVLVSVPTTVLAVSVAVWGLRDTWTTVWVVGTGAIVLLSGPAPQWWNPPDDWHATAITIGAFLYAQVYFGLLGVLHHFWTLRHPEVGAEAEAGERFRMRRMLQVRLALATLVVVFGATSGKTDDYPRVMPMGFLFGLVTLPMLVALWFRVRPLAWVSAALIVAALVPNLLLAPDEGSLQRMLIEYGWAQAVAIYLWIKAARVWYWPDALIREIRDESGGRRTAW